MKKIAKFYNSKYFNIILFISYFIIPFIIYFKLFINDMVPISGDGLATFSMRLFLNNALHDGELPLWNKYLSNGVPYGSDFNGVFYPISILLSFLPIKLFVYSFYSLHMAFGAFFTYLFLKEINCDRFISICTSFIYFFSIHLGGLRKDHIVIITVVVYLPIVLYFIEKFMVTFKLKFLIGSSLALALSFLSGGHIQIVVYLAVCTFFYFITRMFIEKLHLKHILFNITIWGLIFLGMVSIQLIPAAELVFNYKSAGAGETTFQTFSSYSIHPIKIIMMLFPNAFGDNIYESLGSFYSSGFDIELYLGIGVLLFILFALKNYLCDYRVKLSISFMLCALMYASIAHIPVLNKIVYHLPVLGGFRCPSRSLFIFIFFAYVLFAVSFTKLKEANDLSKLYKFISIIIKFVLGVLIIILPFGHLFFADLTLDELIIKFRSIKLIFLKPAITILIILIFIKMMMIISNKYIKRINEIYVGIGAFLLLTTIVETLPYSSITRSMSINEFKSQTGLEQNIKDNINNNKLLFASDAIDAGVESIIQENSNVSMEIPAINSYIAFNNPRLFRLFTNKNIMKPYYNFSGLFTGFIDIKNNLIRQNDLLSMLGVKFILDPKNFFSGNDEVITSLKEKEVIYNKDNEPIINSNGELSVFCEKIDIESETYYKISFTAETDRVQPLFYMDLYGGELYDNNAQQSSFLIEPGKNHYEALINSEQSNNISDIYLRIVTTSISDINITDLKIIKMNADISTNIYKPYYIDENQRVFENTNARDILFTPSKVININDTNDIYEHTYNYDLDDVSYVENIKDFETASTTISDIVWKRNSIYSRVQADNDTFVNFSQNYYPGWKAYIDGKETKIYMVNGLIQGIKVPSGEHSIKFVYIPSTIIIGGVIFLITIIIVILIIRKDRTVR